MRNYVQKVWQVAACLLAIAIVVLSLVPPSHRPITDASHNLEHFAIFWATGLAFGSGYPGRPFVLAIALTISCGVIEVAQRWIPGRHARVSDFIVDAAAGLIGLGIAYIAARVSAFQKLGARI
jgi:VanZ family protein